MGGLYHKILCLKNIVFNVIIPEVINLRKFYRDKQLTGFISVVILLFCFLGYIAIPFSSAMQESMPGYILIGLPVMCIFFTLLFLFMYIRLCRAGRIIREYRTLLSESLEHREEEKRHMALEMHDTVIQDLVYSGMMCNELARSAKDQAEAEKLRSLAGILAGAQKQLRDISCEIRPPDPDRKLDEILSGYVSDWQERTGRSAVYTSLGTESVNIGGSVRLCIYRIVQELLTNIEKHSDATEVKVGIIVSWPDLLLKVSDNGSGFDFAGAMKISDGKAHAGLRGITDRIKISRGTFRISSSPEKGTAVNISVPLEDMNE